MRQLERKKERKSERKIEIERMILLLLSLYKYDIYIGWIWKDFFIPQLSVE